MRINLSKGFVLLLLITGISMFPVITAQGQEDSATTLEDILEEIGEIPTADQIRELFINCSEWDADHEELRYISKDALIEIGLVVVPTILEGWLSSVDIRRRIELDAIVGAIGHGAAQYLIPYLESDDPYTRRHAAYLLGDTAWITRLEDPLEIGPIDADLEAIEALKTMLETETEWDVTSSTLAAIGLFRDPGQIEFLASWLHDDEEAVRKAAVTGLSRIPDQGVVPEIIRAFSDQVTTVRQTALLALSTPVMGNIAFEALIGTSILSPSGRTARLCALETVAKYLDANGTERTELAASQRNRAFDTAISIIENPSETDWTVRGYTVVIVGNSHHPEAEAFLNNLLDHEEHPFVIGKINEALETIEEGLPEPPVDE